jgi:hypothetical protein
VTKHGLIDDDDDDYDDDEILGGIHKSDSDIKRRILVCQGHVIVVGQTRVAEPVDAEWVAPD